MKWILLRFVAVVMASGAHTPLALAATYTVNTSAELSTSVSSLADGDTIELDADIGSRLSMVLNGKLCGTFRCTVFKNLQTLRKKKGYEVSVASMPFIVIKMILKRNVTIIVITTDSPRTGSGGNACLN